MNLFDPIVPPERQNKNFTNVLIPTRVAERLLLTEWANGFIDRDGKFVEQFQTTFNSSFWEVYLFACLKELGYAVDWSHPTPDFVVERGELQFVIEAVTANAAQGKPNEWDKTFSEEEMKSLWPIKRLNTEAMIRLSNAVLTKVKKYESVYSVLPYVRGKPFVIAVAPFEQPHFNLQYDRPIRALLYDYYVDEDAYLEDPAKYPGGVPAVSLGTVVKENGAELELGIFNNKSLREVSAIVFSNTATWGKLSAMSRGNTTDEVIVRSIWATAPDGVPARRICRAEEHSESVLDGLQIYHNPNATFPLSPEAFRAPRVVQHYFDENAADWVYEGRTDSLHFRTVTRLIRRKSPDRS